MAEYRNFQSGERKQVAVPSALSIQHEKTGANHDEPVLDAKIFDLLHRAALDADPHVARQAVIDVLARGQSSEDVFDLYVPAIARVLGDKWCSDELSFASVTIGVSRLQTMLRELGPNWSGDTPTDDGTKTILVVVPQEIYHTLGAIVLSGQLRRKGHSVKLLLGGSPKDVADRVGRTKYNAIFISSSRGEALESLRQIVDAIKTSPQETPPIVIGGTILEVETTETVTALTGADYATKDAQQALDYCGLHVTPLMGKIQEFGT